MAEIYTPDRIAADRAVIDGATRGPWHIDEKLPNVYIRHIGTGWPITSMWHTAEGTYKGDAAFIAAARTGWPEALDEVERLTKELKMAVETIESLEHYLGVIAGSAYIKPGTGVWHTVGLAIDAIKTWRFAKAQKGASNE